MPHRWIAEDGRRHVHLLVISHAVPHELELTIWGNEADDAILLESPVSHTRVERTIINYLEINVTITAGQIRRSKSEGIHKPRESTLVSSASLLRHVYSMLASLGCVKRIDLP